LELGSLSNVDVQDLEGRQQMAADDAERWRTLAAEALAIAEMMTDPEAQRAMLFIAEGYGLLAERAEARKDQKN
jgi:hypothetical protein